MIVESQVSLTIISGAEIAKILGRELQPSKHFDPRSAAFFRVENNNFSIFLEKGYCKEITETSLAHELAHAYHHEINPRKNDIIITEGFATWIEYHYAKRMNYNYEIRQLEFMLKQKSSNEYKRGLQLFLEIEQTKGEAGVFQRIAQE